MGFDMRTKNAIASRIRADIVAGKIPFGTRLTIAQMAERYQTSHMPVREALRELSGEGLLESEPHQGARVRAIDTAFISEILDLRAGIEAYLVRRAVERATDENISQLRSIQDRWEQHITNKDFDAALAANQDFHNLINSIAGGNDAASIAERHGLLLAALWKQFGYSEGRFSSVAGDHRHLIMAFEAKDGLAAELIMGAHVMKSKQILIRKIQTGESAGSSEKTLAAQKSEKASLRKNACKDRK